MKISQAKIRQPSSALEKDIAINSDTVNIFNERNKGEYYLLNTDQLMPFHNQSRLYFEDQNIYELAETIKQHGVRQPLTVIKSKENNGKYEIISGERRFRAALTINLKKLPCIILDDTDSADEIALIENIQREDLHPIELGKAYSILYKNKSYDTHQKIADKLSVPRSQVTEYIAYEQLNESDSIALIKNGISERNLLRKIISIKGGDDRSKYIHQLITTSKKIINSEAIPLHQQKNIIRKSNILSISLHANNVEIKHKPFNKLTRNEKNNLITELKIILEKLED